MNNTILVAGATGNLGGKIVDALLKKKAHVLAIVRKETDEDKIKALKDKGVTVYHVDMASQSEIAIICLGVDCVVSALAGLEETIIGTQKILLSAAVQAQVPRFIPSDYSTDFTNLTPGKNRNLDLRRKFHKSLDKANIKATSIFNGPFTDLLTTDMPLILSKIKRILCWGNPDEVMDFTTTYNIAEFTAAAALDPYTPRYLKIAGDRKSARDFTHIMTELSGKKYRLLKPGTIGMFDLLIYITKAFSSKTDELYPAWQGMQYMRDMMEGRAVIDKYDNDRYKGIHWTSVKDFLKDSEIVRA